MFGMTYVSNFKSIRFFSIISFLILISCIIPTEQTKDEPIQETESVKESDKKDYNDNNKDLTLF